MQLPGKTDRKIADINQFLHFTLRFLQGFARFQHNETRQISLALARNIPHYPHHLTTMRCRYLTPVQKTLMGFTDQLLHPLRIGKTDIRQTLTIDR